MTTPLYDPSKSPAYRISTRKTGNGKWEIHTLHMQVKQEEEYHRKDICGRGRNEHLLLFHHKSFPSSPVLFLEN